jgi:hypothetical protein
VPLPTCVESILDRLIDDMRGSFAEAYRTLNDPIKAAAAIHPVCGIHEVQRLSQIYGDHWRQYLPSEVQRYLHRSMGIV